MHLEKVTTRHSEAGLAGWIASNDATLFTTVLVMVIAIFLYGKLNRGERENRALTGEKQSLSAKLDATASELGSVSDLLEKTTGNLQLTEEQRDQLRKRLVEKLAQITKLNSTLEALLAEKGALESREKTLTASADALGQEKASLLAQRAQLTEAGEALSASNTTLREKLDAIAEQLAGKVAALADVEKERDRLRKQAGELDDIVASLKKKLAELNIELVEARDGAAAVRVATDSKVKELETKLATSDQQVEDYLAKLKEAAVLLDSLKKENRELQVTVTKAEQERQLQLVEEGRNNRELVGLKGPLKRVAILFDASGSMLQAGSGGSDRWADAQDMAGTWLRHLNLEQCVLIVFSSDVRTFPADGTLAKVRGEGGPAAREALLAQLKSVAPRGQTNTLAALRKAYEYDVDTILLFSDGAPSMADTGVFDVNLARQIYDLCGKHPKVPINAIGMGNYFDKEMSTFLQSIARITGGAFRGE